jgi:hypothetical protein
MLPGNNNGARMSIGRPLSSLRSPPQRSYKKNRLNLLETNSDEKIKDIREIYKNILGDLLRESRGKRNSSGRLSPSVSAQRAAEIAIILGIYPAPTALEYETAKGFVSAYHSYKESGMSRIDYLDYQAKRIASQRMHRSIPTANLLGLKTVNNSPNLLSFEPTEQGLKNRGNELKGLFGGRRRNYRKTRRVYKK